MRYFKIVLVILSVMFLFSACEHTQTFDGTVSIGFESDTVRFNYANTFENIPIQFEGNSNVWPISVSVEVVSDYDGDGYPAVEDVDFYLTSKEVFFGKPDDYTDTTASVYSKNVEVSYPDQTKEELRFKLRIVSCSEADVEISREEVVVITSIPDINRLVGTYTISGELYSIDESGETPVFESLGEASYPVSVTANGSVLTVKGLFNNNFNPATGTSDDEEITSFNFTVEGNRAMSMQLGIANSTYFASWFYNCGIDVITESGELLEGPVALSYDSTFSEIFFDQNVRDNMIVFSYYNSEQLHMGWFNYGDSFLKNIRMVKTN